MRIVLTDTWSWPDVRRGGERYLHELGAALVACGHQVRILTTGAKPALTELLGVPVQRLRRRYPVARHLGEYAPEVAFGFQSLFRLSISRIDVWHATSIPDGAAAALIGHVRPDIRTVFTDHGLPARASRAKRPDAYLQDYLARHIGVYVCVSNAAGRLLADDYNRHATVVPPGVDLGRFNPASRRHPVPVIMYSGSLDESRKNLPLLLAAAAKLRRQLPQLEVWLIGTGNPELALEQSSMEARDAVARVGPVPDEELASSYGRAWVTALPSHAESFGMAITESWASGTPVVVLENSGGPAEMVRPPLGVTCADTVDGLAGGIEAGLELSRQPATSERCRHEAAKYDWRTGIVPLMEQVYHRAQ